MEAPRGGIVAKLADDEYVFRLTLDEIEVFEDTFRGIYEVINDFFDDSGREPSFRECKAILTLGLKGGGMSDKDVRTAVSVLTPEDLVAVKIIATGILSAAFVPDRDDDNNDSGGKDRPKGSESGG